MSSQSAAELNLSLQYLDFQETRSQPVPPALMADRPLDMEKYDREAHVIAVATALFRVVRDEIADTETCDKEIAVLRRMLTDPDGISKERYEYVYNDSLGNHTTNSDPLSNRTKHERAVGQASVRNALLVATERHRAEVPLDPLEEYARDQLLLHGRQAERLGGMFSI